MANINISAVNSNQMQMDETLDNTNINLIEEFMNLSEEENKLINLLLEEFKDHKCFNYGALVYMQNLDDDLSNFPHVSELLENYEKVFSTDCFKGFFVIKLTKCKYFLILDYVTYNDGLVIISDDGMGNILNIFKIKNIVMMYNISKTENKTGKINVRILQVMKKLNLI
jgi:hypothetical protein